MALPEGKTFDFDDESSRTSGLLENFDYTGNPRNIKFETKKFSVTCVMNSDTIEKIAVNS